MWFLQISDANKDAITIYKLGSDNPHKPIGTIRTLDEYHNLAARVGANNIGLSSTIDFPKDFTTNKKLIALCKKIRSL